MLDLCYSFGAECDLLFNVKKSLWGFDGVLIGTKYPMLRLGVNNLPRVDSIVYLSVNFKLGMKLCVDYTMRCKKFLAAVCGVLRSKVARYENIFANILVKKCVPILDCGLDCVVLDSYSLNVISKSWNTAFGWLFNYGRHKSTRWLFM